jgi:hypothetical protein
LKFGRPVWTRIGPAIDLSSRRQQASDAGELRALTDEVMGVLTAMVEDLRDAYPQRWAADG